MTLEQSQIFFYLIKLPFNRVSNIAKAVKAIKAAELSIRKYNSENSPTKFLEIAIAIIKQTIAANLERFFFSCSFFSNSSGLSTKINIELPFPLKNISPIKMNRIILKI